MRSIVLFVLCAIAMLFTRSSVVKGVGTSYWTQTSESDFKSGTLENVVATNLGDLKLSRAIKTLMEQDPQISSVNVLAEAPDGSLYAGTGPHGVLLHIKDEKVSTVATLEDTAAVLSLLVEKSGAVMIGTGGSAGRVLKINKPNEKPQVIFEAEGVQYIWGLVQTPDGNLYAATGPQGQLFEIKPDGSKRMVLEAGEGNLLSLISDGKDLLYVGTDPHGLIYRVNRKTGDSFVMYNAGESEVSALALDAKGNLYAGTSEAKDESGSGLDAPGVEKTGRPEGGAVGVPIPSEHPKEPIPAPPNPNPGQPDPIPKSPQARARQPSIYKHRAVAQMNRKTQFVSLVPASMAFGENATKTVTLAFFADAPTDPGNNKPHPKPSPGKPTPKPEPNPNPGKPEPTSRPAQATSTVHQPAVNTTIGAESRQEGNAIYKIDPDGFVTEIFRQPVLILAMIENNGTLLVATGGADGQVYQVRPSDEETLVLAKVEAKEIMCLLAARDGNVYLGTANVATVATMSSGYSTTGAYVSAVLDATQISRFGKIHLNGTLPTGTALTVATRSGNVKEADEKTWSKWSEEALAAEFMPVMSRSARFLQYRLTFSSTDGKATPVVRDISLAYQVPNLAPQIKAIKIAARSSYADASSEIEGGPPKRMESARHQTIGWDAVDSNNDAMIFSLHVRELGEEKWILLKDNLTEATFEWDTRTVADGRYEVKVVASDTNANPPGLGKTASRVSDPITVDNTPPIMGDVKTRQHDGEIHIDLKVVDQTSTVASVDYSVDSNKDWQLVLPSDQIYDSPEESVSFTVPKLKSGKHRVTLRATDSKGNQSFQNLAVEVQ